LPMICIKSRASKGVMAEKKASTLSNEESDLFSCKILIGKIIEMVEVNNMNMLIEGVY